MPRVEPPSPYQQYLVISRCNTICRVDMHYLQGASSRPRSIRLLPTLSAPRQLPGHTVPPPISIDDATMHAGTVIRPTPYDQIVQNGAYTADARPLADRMQTVSSGEPPEALASLTAQDRKKVSQPWPTELTTVRRAATKLRTMYRTPLSVRVRPTAGVVPGKSAAVHYLISYFRR